MTGLWIPLRVPAEEIRMSHQHCADGRRQRALFRRQHRWRCSSPSASGLTCTSGTVPPRGAAAAAPHREHALAVAVCQKLEIPRGGGIGIDCHWRTRVSPRTYPFGPTQYAPGLRSAAGRLRVGREWIGASRDSLHPAPFPDRNRDSETGTPPGVPWQSGILAPSGTAAALQVST